MNLNPRKKILDVVLIKFLIFFQNGLYILL